MTASLTPRTFSKWKPWPPFTLIHSYTHWQHSYQHNMFLNPVHLDQDSSWLWFIKHARVFVHAHVEAWVGSRDCQCGLMWATEEGSVCVNYRWGKGGGDCSEEERGLGGELSRIYWTPRFDCHTYWDHKNRSRPIKPQVTGTGFLNTI